MLVGINHFILQHTNVHRERNRTEKLTLIVLLNEINTINRREISVKDGQSRGQGNENRKLGEIKS